jgi:hypothetical protein
MKFSFKIIVVLLFFSCSDENISSPNEPISLSDVEGTYKLQRISPPTVTHEALDQKLFSLKLVDGDFIMTCIDSNSSMYLDSLNKIEILGRGNGMNWWGRCVREGERLGKVDLTTDWIDILGEDITPSNFSPPFPIATYEYGKQR